jgi:hypothetical protein
MLGTRHLLEEIAKSHQKTALTLDQAAKLFTVAYLGAPIQTQQFQSGDEIDRAYQGLLQFVEPEIVSRSIAKWLKLFKANDDVAARQLAGYGFSLLPDDFPTGNTIKKIDYYDTDKVLNRGDFESPDFNGQQTHL